MRAHRSVGAASLWRWQFWPPGCEMSPHILHHPQIPTAAPAEPGSAGSISAAHPKGFVGAAAACPSSLQPPTFRGGTSLKGPAPRPSPAPFCAPARCYSRASLLNSSYPKARLQAPLM